MVCEAGISRMFESKTKNLSEQPSKKSKAMQTFTTQAHNAELDRQCGYYNKKGHKVSECSGFKERFEWARMKRVCLLWLLFPYVSHTCHAKLCGYDDSTGPHHR